MSDLNNDFIESLNNASNNAITLKDKIGGLSSHNPWPQTMVNSNVPTGVGSINQSKKPGFLPLGLLSPTREQINSDTGSVVKQKYKDYIFYDWSGQRIEKRAGVDNLAKNLTSLSTAERFNESRDIPKNKADLKDSPYSMRDFYLMFGDTSTDYFKHGLQIIDNLTPIENPESGSSNLRLDQFKSTPFENNDPIIFGFEIIIDDVSSPLLNGSILDFINNYSNVSEIASKAPVYEDFKQQFVKFFKTKANVKVDTGRLTMSKMREFSYPELESGKNIYQSGKKAYMSYYLKKIAGLSNLVEQNTGSTKKYLVDYNKDVITLSFNEDVSKSVGTLAHLYKLLYWSKPNGKGIIPENLLRFNCDIIVSECRNFNRVRKASETGDLEIIKDNVSRYIYSLKECQFYFNSMPHDSDIDMGGIKTYDDYSIQFDYKYSTTKFERFVPSSDGFGQYVGYDGGSIWKIGNPGERESRGTQSISSDSSVPKFYTVGLNKLNQNGVDSPLKFSYINNNGTLNRDEDGIGSSGLKAAEKKSEENSNILIEKAKNSILSNLKKEGSNLYPKLFDKLKQTAINSARRETQKLFNVRTALLNQTLNKIMSSNGGSGGNIYANPQKVARNPLYRPPRNIYTDSQLTAGQSIFYDVRGQLFDFLGDSLGSVFGGGLNKPI